MASAATAFFVLALVAPLPIDQIAAPVQSVVERPDEITEAAVLAIQKWITAVQDHGPGQRDAAVEMVSALTFDDRLQMNAGMAFFLRFLNGKPKAIKTVTEERLANLAHAAMAIRGAKAFLKRAAVLHTDAAFKREIDVPAHDRAVKDRAKSDGPAVPPGTGRPYSGLLSQRSLYLNQDGKILGNTPSDWNWPFARHLLALLSPSPADDPFVGTWYHATTAFMFQRQLPGEVIEHLHRAAAVLPDDARILFDRACFAEMLGLPRTQVLLSERALGLPDEDRTNDEAERLFRQALSADPSLVEARVRLGRLLGVRKRHAEAASELATALAAEPSGSVLFYAHLFAGRSAQALGKIADAAAHYKAASQLFPGAQSALLARSQAAVLESDVPAVLDSIQRLDKSSTARDPWWRYHLASGRDVDVLLREMWAQAAK
jgi:tetratricopeptide (TPR) repeat protein